MTIESLFTPQDGGWLDNDSGTIYRDLSELFSEIVSRWKSARYGIEQHEKNIGLVDEVIDQMRAEEFPQYAAVLAELAELKQIEKKLDAIMREIVLQASEKLPGTTVQNRKDVIIDPALAVEWIIAADMPHEWLTLSKEGEKQIKAAVSDRMHKYAGYVPSDVAHYTTKKTAVIRAEELLTGKKEIE